MFSPSSLVLITGSHLLTPACGERGGCSPISTGFHLDSPLQQLVSPRLASQHQHPIITKSSPACAACGFPHPGSLPTPSLLILTTQALISLAHLGSLLLMGERGGRSPQPPVNEAGRWPSSAACTPCTCGVNTALVKEAGQWSHSVSLRA